jgi:hypothetical protein
VDSSSFSKTHSGRLVSNGTGALNNDGLSSSSSARRAASSTAAAAAASMAANSRIQLIQMQMQRQQAAGEGVNMFHNYQGRGIFDIIHLSICLLIFNHFLIPDPFACTCHLIAAANQAKAAAAAAAATAQVKMEFDKLYENSNMNSANSTSRLK